MLIHYWGCSLRKARVKGKAEWGNKAGRANVRGVQASWPQLCSTRSWLSGLAEARGNYCNQNRSSAGRKEEQLNSWFPPVSCLSLVAAPQGVTSTTAQGCAPDRSRQSLRKPGPLQGGLSLSSGLPLAPLSVGGCRAAGKPSLEPLRLK